MNYDCTDAQKKFFWMKKRGFFLSLFLDIEEEEFRIGEIIIGTNYTFSSLFTFSQRNLKIFSAPYTFVVKKIANFKKKDTPKRIV